MLDSTLQFKLQKNADFDRSFLQNFSSIHQLSNRYLSTEHLLNCLEDLPQQLQKMKARPWRSIDWEDLSISQIVGIEPDIFLSILIGTIDTEAPIRGYTQASRQYLEKIDSNIARFVGGTVDDRGNLIELGLWEKEERQHTPTLVRIYQQLTGEKPFLKLPKVRNYQPSNDPYEDLYHHGLHRTLTEYGAACLYLYLAVHTTGVLQQIIEEILQDEINHMMKFWGFGIWLYPDSYDRRLQKIIGNKVRNIICPKSKKDVRPTSRADFVSTFQYMKGILNWQNWSNFHKLEFIYISIFVLDRLRNCSKQLSPQYLNKLLGSKQK
jgi:hypothetical protein